MHTGCSWACETRCIQSTRRLSPPGRGSGSTTTAPAPSDRVQRRKPASRGSGGQAGLAALAPAARDRLASSEPTARATGCSPSRTEVTAALSAAMEDAQTPAADSSSIGPPPRRPCTIEAKPGTSTSPCVVPVASIRTADAAMPRSASALRAAFAASSSFSISVRPRSSTA